MICEQILFMTFLNDTNVILWHTVKWFYVMLCISNNPIDLQSFVSTQLDVNTVLFQIIQFSI